MSFTKWFSALKNRSFLRSSADGRSKPRPRFISQFIHLEDRLVPAYIPLLPDAGTKQAEGLSAVLYAPDQAAFPAKKLITIMNNSSDVIFPIYYGANSTADLTAGTVVRSTITNPGTGYSGDYNIRFSLGTGPEPRTPAAGIAHGNGGIYAVDIKQFGSGYLPTDTPTIVAFDPIGDAKPHSGTDVTAVVQGIPSQLPLDQQGKVSLYDPMDTLNETYRGYIGERVDGKNQLGLQPGHQVTIQVPLAFWDGGRIYMVSNGSVPLSSDHDPGYPLQANGEWSYNPLATKNTLRDIGPGYSFIVMPGSTTGYGADNQDPTTLYANPNGIVMWYHEVGNAPHDFGHGVPAVLTEASLRDPNQVLIAKNMPASEILTIDNYDVSYVDSLALPASMEPTKVPSIPPTPGPDQYTWLGSDLSNTAMQQGIASFTTNNTAVNTTPGSNPNGLGAYFAGMGWDQYYMPPDNKSTANGNITQINNPDNAKHDIPVTIITDNIDGLVDGAVVVISGVTGGQTAINGTWAISNLHKDHVNQNNSFALVGISGNGQQSTGGTWKVLQTTGIHIQKLTSGSTVIAESQNVNATSTFDGTKYNLVSGGSQFHIDTMSTGAATKDKNIISGVSTDQARQFVVGMLLEAKLPPASQVPYFPPGTRITRIQLGTTGANDSTIFLSANSTADGSNGSWPFDGSQYISTSTPDGKPTSSPGSIAPNANTMTVDPKIGMYLKPGMSVIGGGIQTPSNSVPPTLIKSVSTDFTTVTLTQNGTPAGGSGPYTFVGSPDSYVVRGLTNNWYAWADYYVTQLASGAAAAPSSTFNATTISNTGRKDYNSLLLQIKDSADVFDMNQLRVGDVITSGTGALTANPGAPGTPGYDPSLNYTIVNWNAEKRTIELSLPVAATTTPVSGSFSFAPPQYLVRSGDAPAAVPNAISSIDTTSVGSPFTIHTASTAGLSNGMEITIGSVTETATGLPAGEINGKWIVAGLVPNVSFQLQGSSANNESFSGGIWSLHGGSFAYTLNFTVPSNSITQIDNDKDHPITIHTASTAGLTQGQQITITGVSGNTAINGTWTIDIVDSTKFNLVSITGYTFDKGGPKGTGTAASGGNWSPANALQFAQSVYDVMQTFSLLIDPTIYLSRSEAMLNYIIGGNTGTFVENDSGKVFDATHRHTLLPDFRTAHELRDALKSVLRGVYDFNKIPNQVNWYPDPAVATPNATLNGAPITYGIYNLDPYVFFVHRILHNSSYGFSFDDDVANTTAVSSTLQIAVGGNTATQFGALAQNQLTNHEAFTQGAPFGTQHSQGFIDTTSPSAIGQKKLGLITISGLDEATVARLRASDPIKDHPGSYITSEALVNLPPGFVPAVVNILAAPKVTQAITSIENSGGKIKINTANVGTLGIGDIITIVGVSGDTSINKRWEVTNVVNGATKSFELKDSTFTGPYNVDASSNWIWDASFVSFIPPKNWTVPKDLTLHDFKFSGTNGTVVPNNIVPSVLQAPSGTQITINGTGFLGVYGVQFNGYPAKIIGTPTDTAIQVEVPSITANTDGSTYPGPKGKITVRNQSGTNYSAADFVIGAAAGPSVTASTDNRAQNAATLVIDGAGFDATTPGNNTVVFNLGAVGTVTAATATQLTVTFSTAPTSTGSLTAVVTSNGASSGAPVQVANVVAAPAVTLNSANHNQNATTILINGTGFDSSAPENNLVLFNLGAVGTVTAATTTQLTVTLTTPPTSLGSKTAIVTSFGGTSGAATQVANVVAANAPTVTLNTASRAQNATTLIINGTGFDTATPGNNTVAFNLGAAGNVTAATATQLIVTFTTAPTALGSLTAVVTSFGQSSGAPVQVANVVAAPTVTQNTANLLQSAPTLIIDGTGFDATTPENNTLVFNLGAHGVVTAATATQLTVTITSAPTSLGSLTVIVTSFGGTSGAATQVATVVDETPTVALNGTNRAQNASTLIINGTDFDTTPGNNIVAFNLGAAGTVTAATATQLTVTFTTVPTSLGNLTAVVTTNGQSSGAPVQVATVVAAPTVTLSTADLAQSAPTLVINGTGFDATTPGNNTVVLNHGAVGQVTAATGTQLTVTFTTTPTSLGNLTAIVTSHGGSSGAAVQVATLVEAAPTVTLSTEHLAQNAPTLIIDGTGFDADTPANNTVAFNLGAAGTVTAATTTQLTVTFSTAPTALGDFTAVVTTNGQSSGAPVQVADIVAAPTVTLDTTNQPQNVTTIIIDGTGFDVAAENTVVFNLGAVGQVTAATGTQLTVTFTTTPTAIGNLTAVVTSHGGTSGAPVQVATVVAAGPTVTPSTTERARSATTLLINGTGFDTTPGNNSVAFNLGAVGSVTLATATQLTVTFTTTPTAIGNLTAVVTTNGQSSGTPTQVATIVAAPTVTQNTAYHAQTAPTLLINGTGFDDSAPGNNTVVFNLGAVGTVTTATATQLTVTFSTTPTSLGSLTAVVTSNGGTSGAAVQVANVVTADERWIHSLYNVILGRDGSPAEVNSWVSQIASGGRTAVASGIEHSFEGRQHLVSGWYQTYLGRPAAPEESAAWANLIIFGGLTEKQALGSILSSSEYFARAQTVATGPTPNAKLVRSLFQGLLGRPGSDSEVAFWADQIPTKGRDFVVQQILGSLEARTVYVERLYVSLLHRPSDPAGLNGWVSSKLDEIQLRIAFETSNEFYFFG